VILCASHVAGTLRRICHRALWLDHGRVVRQGPLEEVLAAYEEASSTPPAG